MTHDEAKQVHEAQRTAHGSYGPPLTAPECEVTLTTLAAPDVAATVRTLLRLRAPRWRLDQSVTDDIVLCAVELVANACAATPTGKISFRAFFNPADGTLWVGVWDSNPYMPDARPTDLTLADIDALPDEHEFGGWGLPLVMSLAVRHGLEKTTHGKWVYAIFQGPTHPR